MSNRIGFVLIALFAEFVCIESQIGYYRELNATHCGLSRQLLDDEPNGCFEWHHTRATMGRMISGRNISYGEAPWIVYVNMGCTFTVGYNERTCGGSLIADQWVLTAGQCIRQCQGRSAVNNSIEFQVVNITVISGYQFVFNEWSEHRNDSQWLAEHDLEVRDVANWTLHPNSSKIQKGFPNLTGDSPMFQYATYIHDLAILRLSKPIASNPVRRNPICLPSNNYFETIGSYLMIATYGWRERPSGVDWEEYSRRFPAQVSYEVTKPTDFPTLMVTISPEGAGDVCNRDEGGSVWQYINGKAVLVGVHSRYVGPPLVNTGYPGCSPKGYTIHTRVSFYIDWIIDVIRQEETGHQ